VSHPVPGHDLDATILRAQVAEIAQIFAQRAPRGAWCVRRHGCPCWQCDIARIVKYAP
jgi:hypothetical protein